MLWLALAAQTAAWASAQQASQPAPASLEAADSLWYGGLPAGAAESRTAWSPSYAPCSPCPRVYGYAEGLFLERSNDSFDQPMIVETIDGNPGATFLSTSDLDFNFDPAVRAVLGVRLHDGWAIEGSYLGLRDSDASAFITPPDDETNLTFPGGLVTNVISGVDRIYANYSSSLYTAELNLVHCRGNCSAWSNPKAASATPVAGVGNRSRCQTFEWFAGFRYLSLNEGLNLYGERDQQTHDGTVAVEHGPYDIRTNNNLYGGQLGARLRGWGARLGWEATGKAGIFGNDAQQEQYILDFPDFELRPLTGAEDVQVAFLGELSLTAIYRLTDVWSLRAGYNVIWVSGLALAPDQLDFSGTLPAGDQLRSTGSMFLHGASCGVEARW